MKEEADWTISASLESSAWSQLGEETLGGSDKQRSSWLRGQPGKASRGRRGRPKPPTPKGAEVTDGSCPVQGWREATYLGQQCNVRPVSGRREEVTGQLWGLGVG